MSTSTEARTIALDFFARLDRGDVAGAAALLADDVVNHAAIPEAQGRAGFERIQQKLRLAIPDLRGHVEDVIAEGDRVCVRVTMAGTQSGPMTMVRLELPPSGRAATIDQIHVLRIAGGKIVEHWACLDSMALIRQLGLKVVAA